MPFVNLDYLLYLGRRFFYLVQVEVKKEIERVVRVICGWLLVSLLLHGPGNG